MAREAREFRALQALRAMRMLSLTAGCTILVASTGCHSWQPEAAFPQRPPNHARDARVTLADGRRVFLENVRIEGDSIVGERNYGHERHAFALSQVAKVEGRRGDAGKTVALVIGLTLVAGVGAAAAAAATMDLGGCCVSIGSGY